MTLVPLLGLVLAFPGGDIGDLARSVATWTHRPCVALVQTRRRHVWYGGIDNKPSGALTERRVRSLPSRSSR